MKKGLLVLLVLSFILSVAVGVSAAPAKPIIIKLGHGDTADGSWGTCDNGAQVFKRLVEARSGGRIKVEIYPNNQVGSPREMFESVMMGTLQMTWESTNNWAGFVPELMCLTMPYAFDSVTTAYKVLDGPFGVELSDMVTKKVGVRFLAYTHIGFRNFTNNRRPIHNPNDIKGLKIRTQEDPAMMKLVESLGGSATPIAWGELYTALQQGVVDGEENPTSMIQVAKLYEVQKYLTFDGHIFGINPVAINEKFFRSLPKDLQEIVEDSAKIGAMAYRGMVEYGNSIDLSDLDKKGMEIYVPTTAELKQFRDKAQGPVRDYVVSKIGRTWVDKFFNAIAAAEKN